MKYLKPIFSILFTLLLAFSSILSYSQNVEIKGDLNGQPINFSSTEIHGSLEVHQINIMFPTISLVSIKAIEIRGLNYDQNNSGKTFKIVEKPGNESEVRVELNIANTCSGDIKCKNGELVIEELSDKYIKATGFLVFKQIATQFNSGSGIDTVTIAINTPLFDAIPKLAKEELSKNHQFENIVISGKLSEEFVFGAKIEEKYLLGDVEFGIGSIEIEMKELEKDWTQLELELWSPFSSRYDFSTIHRFDQKLKPGKYEILPMPEFKDSLDYIHILKTTKVNQIYGQIDDDKIYEDFPIMGSLTIEHLSEKRMKGSFDIKVLYDDKKEELQGKFELPVEIR